MRSNHFQWSDSRVYKNEILHPPTFFSCEMVYGRMNARAQSHRGRRHRCAAVIAATFVTFRIHFTGFYINFQTRFIDAINTRFIIIFRNNKITTILNFVLHSAFSLSLYFALPRVLSLFALFLRSHVAQLLFQNAITQMDIDYVLCEKEEEREKNCAGAGT